MDLMEFSMTEGNDTLTGDENFLPPQLMQTPVVVNSILKPSTKGNLMQLHTPKPPQKLKVKFETPHSVKKVTPTRYEKIADLDEKENWIERTAIVTKTDHIDNIECAKEIVASLVDNLPLSKSESKTDKPGNEIDDDETFFDASEEIKNEGPATHSASIPLIPSQEHVTVQTQNSSNTLSTLAPQQVASPLPVSAQLQVASPLPVSAQLQVASPLPVSVPHQVASPLPVSVPHQVASPLPVSAQQQAASPLPVLAQQQEASPLPVSAQQQVASPLPVSAIPTDPGILDVSMECCEADTMMTDEPMDCDETMLQTTVICNQTLVGNKTLGQEIVQNSAPPTVTSPPLPASKGGYSIDFDNLDSFNPFQTKAAITNSPVLNVEISSKEDGGKPSADPVEAGDGKKPSVEPVGICRGELDAETPEGILDIEADVDTDLLSEVLPGNTGDQLEKGGYSLDLDENADPFATKTQIKNSPLSDAHQTKQPEFDTNKTTVNNSQSLNGDNTTPKRPVKADDADPFSTKSKVNNSPTNVLKNSNPFATKANLCNSPVLPTGNILAKSPVVPATGMTVEKPLGSEVSALSIVQPTLDTFNSCDPFATKSTVVNSPVPGSHIMENVSKAKESSSEVSQNDGLQSDEGKVSDIKFDLDIDLLAPSSMIVTGSENVVKNVCDESVTLIQAAPIADTGLRTVNDDSGNHPTITQLTVSNPVLTSVTAKDDTLADLDPFSTKSKVANSPAATMDPFSTKSKVANSPAATLDPFSTKSKVANSPAAKQSEDEMIDPFSTKSKVANSPAVKQPEAPMVDPFLTKLKVANSPAAKQSEDEMIDPFSTKSKVANSPTQKEPESPMIDPFSTKSKVANSPTAKSSDNAMVDPFSTKSKVANSPTQKGPEAPMIDCFSTKSKVENSPAVKQTENPMIDPFSTMSKVANSPTAKSSDDAMDDPFSTKSKVANSPALKQPEDPTIDPFSAKSKVENSPTVKQLEDPMIDPFSTKSKVANSPAAKFSDDAMVDPFSTKSKVANSPALKQPEDPTIDSFSAKSKVANSPAAKSSEDPMIDPFSTKSKVANSPTAKPAEDPNPFATKSKVPNSPSGPGLTENTAPTRHISGKSTSDNKVLDAKTDPFPASVSNEAVFPDEEFRPATECLFNDSSFLDVLEKFGSSSAENKVSDLARMSLYVKFDPLVDLPPTDPRRASMNLLKRASIMNMPRKSLCGKSIADVCNSEESMLLMGTPPKQMSRLANVTGRPHHTGFTPGSIPTTPKSLKPQLDLLCANTPPPSAKKFVTPAPEKKNSNLPEEPEDSLAASSDDNIIEVLQYTDKDMYEMKKEVFLEFQGQKLLLEREWTKVVDQLKAKIEDQNKALEKKQTDIDQMGFVSKELEIIVEGLIKETENLKSANEDLKKERDQSVQDTQSLEKAFSELHRRNEKLKELMSGYMKNEETLKEHAKELQKVLSTVKTESKEKITELSQQLAKAKSDLNQITASSEARTKRDKLQIESLQKTVEQKMSENKDLTQMCDELLAKVTQ